MNPLSHAIRSRLRYVAVALIVYCALSPHRIRAQRAELRNYKAAPAASRPTDANIRIVALNGDTSPPPVVTSVATNMTWHGGAVQHNQKVFTIFWNPTGTPFPAGYQSTINQFIQDLSGSALQALTTQYTDGTGHISPTVIFGGTWLDTTNAVPSNPVSVGDLQAEVNRAKVANGWTDDANTYYQVFSPPGNGTSAPYCGFHVTTNPAFGVIVYPADHGSGTCFISGTNPNGQIIDGAIDVTSHEILETVTDPFGSGWYYINGGGEIGDLCNFNFGPRAADGSNMIMNGHPYLAQQEWSNAVSGCALTAAGILAGNSSLVTESIPNGRLDPGEAVSASLCMTNFNPVTSGTIIGTLQATGGVMSPSGAQSYGTIGAFASTCHTYSFAVGSSCGAQLTATLQEQESGGPTKNLTYTFQVGSSGAPFFSQNFDGVVAPALPAGWTTSTLFGTTNLWVTNATSSDTAPNHAFAADPATASDSVLVSPSMAIPATGGQLTFRHSFNLDFDTGGYYDGGVLEISIGGGAFTDVITAGGSFVTGGYTAPLFVGSGNPIGGRSAWAGNSGGYITSTINLPPSADGQNVQLWWRLATDSSVAFTGWSVDSITVSGFQCGGASPVTLAATNVGTTNAKLNGTVNPNGTSTTALFDYGQTMGYGTQMVATPAPGSGSSPVAVSGAIAGLTCNTLYHFRVSANNSNGPTTGPDLTFTTAACPPGGNYVQNGTFGSGLTNWQTFATPDLTYISAGVSSGVMQFSRVPAPPGTSNQATVFENTGVSLPGRAPLLAQFDLGNTSTVRKYMKVLVIDADFSDFAACTFWLPPSSMLQTYQLKTYTTKPWANASIYFYAGTANAPGDTGVYQVDNVSVAYAPAQAADRTDCVDPLAPMAPGGAPSANLLTNGDFGTNALPPWTTFGTITAQAPSGVLQMIRPTATLPAGVVLQATAQAMTTGQILTSTFQLGNSSGVRKRVTAIMHDNDFSDLVACVFWLAPGQPLLNYSIVGWASKAWTNATMSFYAATIGPDQWTLVDNVVYQRTPSTSVGGSNCIEPAGGASLLAPEPRLLVLSASDVGHGPTPAQTAFGSRTSGGTGLVGDGGFARSASGGAWEAVVGAAGTTTLAWPDEVDLRQARAARLTFDSRVSTAGSQAAVQVSGDGLNWITVGVVPASDDWQRTDVDLTAFVGQVVHAQLVFDAVATDSADPDSWEVDNLSVEIAEGP